FERPDADRISAALALLARLGLIESGGSGRSGESGGSGGLRLTELGEQVKRIPLHPRLARMLIAAGGARQMAQACALLSERHLLPPRTATTASDLLSALDQWRDVAPHVDRTARAIEQSVNQSAIRNPQSAMASE